MISFKQMLRSLRQYHEDTKLSTLTLCDIFGTENPSLINAIPREEFIARVNAKKQDLDLPVTVTESELAARRAEWEAGTPMFKHDGCSVAFPKDNFYLHLFQHLSGHQPGKAGQPPTPVQRASHYCREKTACEDCQRWVQKVAEGSVSLESLETPGAGWVPSRDQVLGVAARVRAALPGITFGGVELPEVLDVQVRLKSRGGTLEDKLMGLTTGQAVGAVKHALRQCNKRSVKGGHMDAATYHSSFVPHFMAHLGLTDVKKVPSQNTLQAIYIAHKGDGRRGRSRPVETGPTAPPPPRIKRARRAPKKMED